MNAFNAVENILLKIMHFPSRHWLERSGVSHFAFPNAYGYRRVAAGNVRLAKQIAPRRKHGMLDKLRDRLAAAFPTRPCLLHQDCPLVWPRHVKLPASPWRIRPCRLSGTRAMSAFRPAGQRRPFPIFEPSRGFARDRLKKRPNAAKRPNLKPVAALLHKIQRKPADRGIDACVVFARHVD